MTTPNVAADQAWSKLADVADEKEREAKMLQRYRELGALSEEQRQAQMQAMALAEYALPDEKLRSFTVSRLRAWLRLERETAQKTSASYDAVMKNVSGDYAMRWAGLLHTLAREFSLDDQKRLLALFPAVFGVAPTAIKLTSTDSSGSAPAKKSRWPFGKR